jgi:hypothetical protein
VRSGGWQGLWLEERIDHIFCSAVGVIPCVWSPCRRSRKDQSGRPGDAVRDRSPYGKSITVLTLKATFPHLVLFKGIVIAQRHSDMGNCIGRTLNLKFRRERGKDILCRVGNLRVG